LDGKTLVASPGKDYVVEAMGKESGKGKRGLNDKEFQAVLARLDGGQSVSFAAVGAAFKGADADVIKGADSDLFGDWLEKLTAAGGGVTVSDEVKLEVVLSTRTEDDARKVKEAVSAVLNSGVALLGLAAGDNNELDKVLDVLKSIKANAKGKTITLRARVPTDVLEEWFDKVEK
jgi:hypothetical protein